MKKIFIVSSLVFILLVAGCGKEVVPEEKAEVSYTAVSEESHKQEEKQEIVEERTSVDYVEEESADYSYEEEYDYSSDDYYDGSYEDYNYADYDAGYYVTGEYDDGFGRYLCDYGTYYAKNADGNILASLSVYNHEGAMYAEFSVSDYGPDDQYIYATIYCDASDAFGDASRDTEVEMHVEGDIYGNNIYSEDWLSNGTLDVVVYYPETKATLSYVAGNGERFNYTMYP